MTAKSLTTRGLRRTRAGSALFGRAMRDAGRGLRLMLSGLGLLLAGLAVKLKETLAVPRVRMAPLMRRWGLYGLRAGLACLAVVAGVSLLVFIASNLPEDMIIPDDLAARVGLLAMAGGALFLVVALLLSMLMAAVRFLMRRSAQILRSMGVLLLACALGAALYALMQPPLREGVIAGLASACLALGVDLSVLDGLAVLAVLAPLALVALVALISLGPSLVSVFSLGGRGAAPGDAGCVPVSPGASSRPAQGLFSRWRQAIRSRARPARVDLAPARLEERSTPPPVGAMRGLTGRWIGCALLVLLALILAWQAGAFLLAARSALPQGANTAPGAAASQPASPAPASTGPSPQDRPAAPHARPAPLQLLADGRAADVSWRSGYRNRTARQDDGSQISALALPGTACDAAMIFVFGSASSDGDRTRNDALALHRARWLGDWTQAQLARCPGGTPAIGVLSLGQARSGPPQSQQRAVRLMALGRQELADLLSARDPATALRRLAETAFGDLRDYERFDGCHLTSQDTAPDTQAGAPILIRGLPEACEADRR